MNDTALDFYGHYLSVPSCKVGLMLSMAGIDHAYHHVDLLTGAQKAPEFRALNRFAQVPVIVQDGKAICQSDVILVTLAERYGTLDGATAEERLRVREWLAWQADRLWNLARARGQIMFQNGTRNVIEQLQGGAREALEVLDGHLKGAAFIVGAAPSVADVACFAVIAHAEEAGIDLAPWGGIAAWRGRMTAQAGCAGPDEIMPRESRA